MAGAVNVSYCHWVVNGLVASCSWSTAILTFTCKECIAIAM